MPLNSPCPERPEGGHCFCGMEGDDTCCLCLYIQAPQAPPRRVVRPAAQVREFVVEPQVANWADQLFAPIPGAEQFAVGQWVNEPVSWDIETPIGKPLSKKAKKTVEPEDDGSLENVDWDV